MSLYKRGDVWHYDFTYLGERQRGTTRHSTKAKAARFVEDLRDELRTAGQLGRGAPRAAATIGQVADQYFASRIAGKKTAITTAQRINILFRHLDRGLPVSAIGAPEVEAAIMSRRAERIRQSSDAKPRYPSNGTVNRDIIDSTLRPMLAYAEEIMEQPVKRIRWARLKLTEPKGRMRVYTDQEIAAWREALPEWHRPIFDFIARYGVRLGEAFFPPAAVNPEAGEIYLSDTKNGRDHTIPLLEEDVAGVVSRMSRAAAAKLDTIWFKDDAGVLTPIHWRAFQSASRQALDRADIQGAAPVHGLRHHAATTLQRDTGNIKLVQELLNHQSIASSARYAHASKADLKAGLRHTYATSEPKEQKLSMKSKAGSVT